MTIITDAPLTANAWWLSGGVVTLSVNGEVWHDCNPHNAACASATCTRTFRR